MRLLFDIGNSSVNWVTEDQGQFINFSSLSYKTDIDVSKLESKISESISSVPDSVAISNVMGEASLNKIKRWLNKKWNIEPGIARVEKTFGDLKNSYTDVTQMGVDRWLAMIAAWEKHKSALCVVDCGTALTIDLIDNKGQHLGGYILPGHELLQDVLISNAEGINVQIEHSLSIEPATNTQDAVTNGAGLGLLASIEYAIRTFSTQHQTQFKCLLTGGKGVQLQTLLDDLCDYEPMLVLQGLSLYEDSRL